MSIPVNPYPDPPPVPCYGCGKPTPYRAGPADSDAPSYGEWHDAPLGLCYVRTHRTRECVLKARARNGVERATKLGPTDEERKRKQLDTSSPTERTP